MNITLYELQVLLEATKHSCAFYERADGRCGFGFPRQTRIEVLNSIANKMNRTEIQISPTKSDEET